MNSKIADSLGKAPDKTPWGATSKCSWRFVCFNMHEVVNLRGILFYDAQELARDPKYISLREWENQEHRASSSSVRTG